MPTVEQANLHQTTRPKLVNMDQNTNCRPSDIVKKCATKALTYSMINISSSVQCLRPGEAQGVQTASCLFLSSFEQSVGPSLQIPREGLTLSP